MISNIFFIIGAQRSGSTFLYNILDQHPEICMAKPLRPEPKFFITDKLWNKGLSHYESAYYSHANKPTIYGEKSVSYYESEIATQRLYQSFPNAKIILILRNPVLRAISNYKFSKDNGLENRSLEDVFIKKKPITSQVNTSVSPFDYLNRGKYISFIKMYLKYYKQNQIYIGILEEIVGNLPELQKFFSFLNVSDNFVPLDFEKPINESKKQSDVANDSVINFLHDYYLPFNKQLEDYIGRELLIWK